jgi:hypothetical protein
VRVPDSDKRLFVEEVVTTAHFVKFFGTLGLGVLLASSGIASARDSHRQRGTQPHTRTTERQRTENGHTRSDTVTRADGATATRQAVVVNDRDAGTRTRDVDYTGFDGQTHSVDGTRTKTDDGFTRSATLTNAQGDVASRNLVVSRDAQTGTATRSSSYATFDGREGTKSDVIQRTEDGYTRDTTRTLPNGETHTRNADVSCDKDAGNCVKQVEVDQQP